MDAGATVVHDGTGDPAVAGAPLAERRLSRETRTTGM
jgi:hypothetical protein